MGIRRWGRRTRFESRARDASPGRRRNDRDARTQRSPGRRAAQGPHRRLGALLRAAGHRRVGRRSGDGSLDDARAVMTTREELREAELDLMRQKESVAEMRRALPLEPVDDYVFRDESGDVRLSELFSAPGRTLILYHYM